MPLAVADLQQLLVIIPTADRHHDKVFCRGIKEEQPLLRAIAHLKEAGSDPSGRVFVDVGANIGTTTLLALEVGFGSAVACEPNAGNFRLLKTNVVLNGFEERVQALNLALAAQSGTGILRIVPRNSGGSYLLAQQAKPHHQTQPVTTTTLDDLAATVIVDPAGIGLLWMEVEGYEPYVLGGASKSLAAGVPVVMEVNPDTLKRSGGLAELPEIVGSLFTHIADLRHPEAGILGVEHIGAVLAACEQRGRATDMLAFNNRS